jgi:hypothetical protein
VDRSNHYEAAFEAYLQWHRLCYIAVDETRRALLGDRRIKSLDFVVYGGSGARLVVDVKGRRYPGGPAGKPKRTWENWSTREDVESLERWARLFGPDYLGLLVFAYQVAADVELPGDVADLWTWRGRRYLLRAVPAPAYRRHMKVRSPKWGTVGLPGAVFRQLVRPLRHFTHGQPTVAEECPF